MQATWRGLEQALRQNLTRSIGVSNFRSEHIKVVAGFAGHNPKPILCQDLMHTAEVTPAVNQAQMYIGRHDDEAIALCRQLNITYEAYSPFGPWHQPKPVLTDPTVAAVAKRHNVTAAMVGMRWLVQGGHPVVTASAAAAFDVEDTTGIFEFQLTAKEMATLAAVPIDRLDQVSTHAHDAHWRT